MLVVLASTGVLRGLQNTRTPLYVAIAGFLANAVLNVVLVYGADLGIAGSAWGTVIAQCGMARCTSGWWSAGHVGTVPRCARTSPASGHRPRPGAPLLVRTLSLRAILMIATAVAARLGDADIAAHQIVLSLWSLLLAFALDAIAIAGQAIIGRYLGAGDTQGARDACRRMVEWGVAVGVGLGLLVVLSRPAFLPCSPATPRRQGHRPARSCDRGRLAADLRSGLRPGRGSHGGRRRPLSRLGDAAYPGGLHSVALLVPALGGGPAACGRP